ncbi:pkd2 [Symbiodinium natans]|uniref:Pkd2 protein n=1 Tax=Symbiodinium natans TaxID=878477 RepID=A0A812Q7G6_9DINO|nr:pkd2 [Symbiodinium natans]
MAAAVATTLNVADDGSDDGQCRTKRESFFSADAGAYAGQSAGTGGGTPTPVGSTDLAGWPPPAKRKSEVPTFLANQAARSMPRPLLCSSLLVTLTYWFCFVYSQVVHQNTAASWEIRATFKNFENIMDRRTSKLKADVGDEPDDIVFKDYSEMYTWLRDGYLPLLWEEGPYGRGLLAGRMRLVGGVRLSRQRAQPVKCSGESSEKRWVDAIYNQSCFSAGGETTIEEDTYWLDIMEDQNTMLEHLLHLETSGWITRETIEISIQAFYFNAQSENFVLTQVEFSLEDTGYLHGENEVLMVPSDIYSAKGRFFLSNVGADVLAGFCLAACLFVEVLMWRQAVKNLELKAFIFNIYRLANLLSFVGGIVYLCYYAYLSGSVDQIALKLSELSDLQDQGFMARVPGQLTGARYSLLDEIHDLAFEASVLYRGAQWICFWYMLVLLIKFGEGSKRA